MARHLRHVLQDHLHTSQFCGGSGNSVLEAVSLVRDVIAYSESSGTPLCVFTPDFFSVGGNIPFSFVLPTLFQCYKNTQSPSCHIEDDTQNFIYIIYFIFCCTYLNILLLTIHHYFIYHIRQG